MECVLIIRRIRIYKHVMGFVFILFYVEQSGIKIFLCRLLSNAYV